MKKQFLLSLLAIAITTTTVKAQEAIAAAPQNVEQKQPNERTKETLLKLQAELGISNDQSAKAYPVFEAFYTAQQKLREEMRASGSNDREKMKAGREELVTKRDEQLKEIFTEAQMKKWKEEVEPSMRSQRKNKQ
jgi:periplasmic protein CpxP/Spy